MVYDGEKVGLVHSFHQRNKCDSSNVKVIYIYCVTKSAAGTASECVKIATNAIVDF